MIQTPFQRRRRTAARIALYGSLVLVLGAAVGLVSLLGRPIKAQQGELWVGHDYLNDPAVKLFQRYVQIDTSPATGDEMAGARFLAEQLRAAGIEPRIERLGNGHVNLWAVIEGRRREALVLHNHIDVSNVEDLEKWFEPPFAATIDLPWMYGRGVFDMKSVAIAQLQAFLALKRSGVEPEHSVIFLATGDEEYGSRFGTQWLLARHPELVRRFAVVLTEGGVVEARTRNDIKYWGTEFAQKRFADLVVCGPDRESIEALRDLVAERVDHTRHLRTVPEVRDYLAAYHPSRDRQELRRTLADPAAIFGELAFFQTLPKYVQSLFRDEAVPFSWGEAPGGGWELVIKFHLLPGTELADVRDELVPAWMLHGFATTLREPASSRHGSPPDHRVVQLLGEAVEERHDGARTGPMFLPWTATDARFFRAAGIPAYGFSPFLIMSTDTFQVDAPNERIALPGFVEGVALYTDAVRRIASDTKW